MKSPRPVADVWSNYWPSELFERFAPLAELYGRLGLNHRANLDADHLLDTATTLGPSSKLLVAGAPVGGSAVANDAVAELCARRPGTMVPVASVDARRGMAAVHELRRAVTDLGCVALRIVPFFTGLAPSAPELYPLYATCIDLDVPAMVLTGHTAVHGPTGSNDLGRPQHLDEVALHFPELRIVAGHGGYPWTDELIGLAWKHERLFIETSGHRPRHLPASLRHFMATYGAGKVMFGTGYPLFDPTDLLADVPALDLSDTAADRWLWSTAAEVFGWG